RVPEELWEQQIIVENQISRDNAIAATSEVMLCDTPVTASYVFAKRILLDKLAQENRIEPNPAEYKYLEEMHDKTLHRLNGYDIIFVFGPHDELVSDGVRKETQEDKYVIYNALKGFLDAETTPYYLVEGSFEEKVDFCYNTIINHLKQKSK